MKKYLFILIMALAASFASAQVKNNDTISDKVITQKNDVKYQLFATQNMWNFIKLDTSTGQMWQVQYDVGGTNRMEVFLNVLPLLIHPSDEKNGRFTLYPTQNIYNFILLDQIDGRVWQVQWSTNAEKRLVIPIF